LLPKLVEPNPLISFIGGHKFVSSFHRFRFETIVRNDRYKRPTSVMCLERRNGNDQGFSNMRNDVAVTFSQHRKEKNDVTVTYSIDLFCKVKNDVTVTFQPNH
jgi:hypothetical protein